MREDEKIHATRSALLDMIQALTMEGGFNSEDLAKLHIDSAVYRVQAIWNSKEQP